MKLRIIEEKIVEDVPSASGIVKHHGFYYVIGDDSPYLFKLNHHFEVVEKYPIHSSEEIPQFKRIPKKKKPDFEGLELISDGVFIIIGSGSRSPQRDDLVLIDVRAGHSIKRYKLTSFYVALAKMEIMDGKELNIEAIAYSNNILHLFNRGRNVIFKIKFDDLLRYLTEGGASPVIEAEVYHLPQLRGIEAGFSGATIYEKEQLILLTASVENTDNAYDDGAILGSFIGVIPMNSSKSAVHWHQIKRLETALKIESVTIDKVINHSELEITLTADNDDGRSTFVKGNISW